MTHKHPLYRPDFFATPTSICGLLISPLFDCLRGPFYRYSRPRDVPGSPPSSVISFFPLRRCANSFIPGDGPFPACKPDIFTLIMPLPGAYTIELLPPRRCLKILFTIPLSKLGERSDRSDREPVPGAGLAAPPIPFPLFALEFLHP